MEKQQKSGLWQALSLAGQLGYTIAIPLVALALIGRFLDKKYNSSPWFLLAGILVSLIITSIWVWKKSMSIMAEMDKELKKQNENFEKIAKNNEKIKNNDNNSVPKIETS
ncbi:AtpZ/AtpI family protein [Patescibacteria group bacterium]|nr:AtpZ/AtpI family protein [Patescibacteria group bacterium]